MVVTSEIIRSVGPRLTSPSKGGVDENIERMVSYARSARMKQQKNNRSEALNCEVHDADIELLRSTWDCWHLTLLMSINMMLKVTATVCDVAKLRGTLPECNINHIISALDRSLTAERIDPHSVHRELNGWIGWSLVCWVECC